MKPMPMALAQCKASVHLSGAVDLRSARRFGVEALSTLVGSRDLVAVMRAFLEEE